MRRPIWMLFVAPLLFLGCSPERTSYKVQDGVLDLRSAQVDSSFILNLDGAWEFYWKRLLTPGDFQKAPAPDIFLDEPDAWNAARIAGHELGGTGYATYRLRILLPENSPPLSLKLLDSGSSYRFWVNGQYYGGAGVVSSNPDEAMPSYRTALYDLIAPGESVELVIQVANFHHRKGGIWEPIKFGSYDAIHSYREYMLIFEGFLAGSLVIMGFYHIGLFLLRKKDRSTLWFGLFCLDIALRTMVTGERILHGVVPFEYWEALLKVEYISMNVGLPLFLLFLRSLYPSEIPLRMTQILIGIDLALVLLVLVTPARIYSHSVDFHQLVIVVGVLLCTYGLLKSVVRRRDGAVVVSLTSFIFILTVLNDILYNQQVIFTFQMVGFGLFIFIFSQSFILSLKFSRAFSTIEALSENLQRYNRAYSRFVPREFLRFLQKESILDIHLGDQVQTEMTVLFVDIRSFTTISEHMTPKENFDFLNDYLGRIGPLIRKNNGFIDKYLGDGLMALFPEGAEDALQAALEIQKAINVFNEELTQWGRPAIRVGAGIHTGRLMLGTVGEQERMDGTVISDAVNLASRIEGLTRSYGSSIVISEESLVRLEDPNKFCYRFLGKVRVKGKTEPVSVFEVFDLDPTEMRIVKQVTRTEFEKGIMALHRGEYDEARKLFEGILRANPEDEAAALYIRKLDKLVPRNEGRSA
ncbi:adenylate/guanylate cyclase domain-containing protein [Leptonema illini]|uniref:Adenylate/guanylate cyclase n=1 Tax=Leptonema illini DSM 21528 TaxID=929563 RepID=H2CAI3_9LEPT|nr:adenylate/guanylate cyclase domain-containing protein [Leptonema illini]EHQ07350.1 adenylate/guanylate cyclase [Leptonema illini DSM 21528]